jgi:RHS repeat-associated protein
MDYFLARYYSSIQGRFTGVDPDNYQARLDLTDPQSWNAYSYVNNNPLARVDSDGRGFFTKLKNYIWWGVWGEEADVKLEEQKRRQMMLNMQKENGGELIILNWGGNYVRVDPANMTRFQVFTWSNRIMEIREQGGGFRQLTPEEYAGVIDATSVARPAMRGDPYHPDNVAQRQNTELTQLRERMQSLGREAERLGFKRRIPPQKAPFDSHGQEVFSNGRRFITRDIDSHSGGVWKMYDRQGRRLGTYDAKLKRIGD